MSRPRNPALYYNGGDYRLYNSERRGKPTLRKDLDPIFFELAARAATNGAHRGHCGCQQVNFGRPTTNPHGYFAVLTWINAHPKCHLKDIKNAIFNGKTPIATVERLLDGGLVGINHFTHEYEATELGKCYLAACDKKYLGKRASHPYNWSR